MRRVYVTPGGMTSRQARAGMVVAALFLVFGLAFGAVVLSESPDSEPGLRLLLGLFFLIFVVVCGSIIVSFARLQSGKGSPRDRAVVELEVEAPAGAAGDFEARLRKLEALRQGGLVSEPEYQAKRKQIMGEPW